MDHTRASVLSVCTAAIIGAGASAGGLEKGAGSGGPTDWLDCGVRYITPEEREEVLNWEPGTARYEYLSFQQGIVPGSRVEVAVNWMETDSLEDGDSPVQNEFVGTFIPTYTGSSPLDRYSMGRVRIMEGMTTPPNEGVFPDSCGPTLICRCWELSADLYYQASSVSGILETEEARIYLSGTQMEYTVAMHDESVDDLVIRAFIPTFVANSIPLNQDSAEIEPWLANRIRAESGAIDETPEEIDALFSMDETLLEPSLTKTERCIDLCLNQWLLTRNQIKTAFDIRRALCRANRINNATRIGIHVGMIGTCVGTGTAFGCLGGPVGAGIGAGVGLLAGIGGIVFCESEVFDDTADLDQYIACMKAAWALRKTAEQLADQVVDGCINSCIDAEEERGSGLPDRAP